MPIALNRFERTSETITTTDWTLKRHGEPDNNFLKSSRPSGNKEIKPAFGGSRLYVTTSCASVSLGKTKKTGDSNTAKCSYVNVYL